MLVLSRREKDKILFPSLGITVEVLRVQGNRARIGVDAPQDVPILRHEVADLKGIEFATGQQDSDRQMKDLVYAIRSRLDAAATILNAMHTHAESTQSDQMQTLIENLFSELRVLEREANQVLEQSGVAVNHCPQALLVEDSEVERRLMEAYLDLSGFQIISAKDGQDALDYLSMHACPDVVLLDMLMPRVDGPSFVTQVRNNPSLQGLSIFALTGVDQSTLEIPTGPEGVDRWYTKPVDPKQLVADLAEHLTHRPLMVA